MAFAQPTYSKLPLHESDEESKAATAKPSVLGTKYPLSWFISVYLATVFLGVFSIILISSKMSGQCQFPSEMYLSATIPRIPMRFHGSPHFEANGTAWREAIDSSARWPENKAYFGNPGAEIDDEWNHLIRPRYFSVSEVEAKRAWGVGYTKYRDPLLGGYTAGFSMFHALHCLDSARMALQREFYPFTELHGAVHLEHCLDFLRQEIQCYGSTTLIPQKHFEGLSHPYIDADQVHTCRDFNTLKEFTLDRQRGGNLYVPRVQWSSEEVQQLKKELELNSLS